MIARLRELLDVARAMLRGPASTFAISVHELDRNPAYGIGLDAEPDLSPGLVPCPTCATMQQPREGHMAVHFADARDQRPCVGSWPARKVGA